MTTYNPPLETLPVFCDSVFPEKTTDTGNYVELTRDQKQYLDELPEDRKKSL